MENRPSLGAVDLAAGEHRFDVCPEIDRFSQGEKQAHCLSGYPVLGVIQEQAGGLGGVGFTSPRIIPEKVPEMHSPDVLVMLLQGFPLFEINCLLHCFLHVCSFRPWLRHGQYPEQRPLGCSLITRQEDPAEPPRDYHRQMYRRIINQTGFRYHGLPAHGSWRNLSISNHDKRD